MMQHYQHNKRTQKLCYVVLLLYYRFKFLKNITPKSVWLMPDLNNPKIIQIWHLLEFLSPNCSDWTMVSAKCAIALESEASFKPGNLVELRGIEPRTSCVQGRRSPSWAIAPVLDLFPCSRVTFFARLVTYHFVCSRRPQKLRLATEKNLCALYQQVRKNPTLN